MGLVIKHSFCLEKNNDDQYELDVTAQLPDPVVGTFDYNNFTSSDITIDDGYYKIEYIVINDSDVTYKNCVEKYFYPNVKCCISNLVKRVQENPNEEKYYNDLLKAKAWEKALCSAAATVDKATADKMLALLQRFCNYNPCGC